MDFIIMSIVYAVVFEIMFHFRLKKKEKEWDKGWEDLVRGLVKVANKLHDLKKPYRISELEYRGIDLVKDEE